MNGSEQTTEGCFPLYEEVTCKKSIATARKYIAMAGFEPSMASWLLKSQYTPADIQSVWLVASLLPD